MGKGAQEKNHPDQEEVLNPPRDEEKQCKWDSSPHGMGRKCRHVQPLLPPLCVVLSVLVLVLLVALIVVQLQSRSSHPQFFHVCLAMWIGFQSKCYYFSENESNWNNSLENCKAMEASLTSIDSLEELAFIKRYKGQANHWFGLHEDVNGRWRWTNGTAFNNCLRNIYIKTFSGQPLQEKWNGLYQVLLRTHTAIKIREQAAWIHYSRVKKAPGAPWKVTLGDNELKLKLSRTK